MAQQESQKAYEALEPKDQKFIKEFIGIDRQDALALYERSNQPKILDSSVFVRDAFDKHWRSITGDPYFSPITTRAIQGPAASGMHPKSTKYRVNRTFKSIRWTKTVNEIPAKQGGVRKVVVFDVFGTMENGKEVAIERNVDTNQMIGIMPTEIIATISSEGKKPTVMDGVITPTHPVNISITGYWEVIFSPQGNKDDPEDVTLTWNGHCLQIKRNERVVLPGYYLEIADNATYPKYIQTPEQSRKIAAYVQFFPYTVLREASEDEYLMQKREGDRLTKEARRREEELS